MSHDIAQQTEVENGMLKLLMEGLRSTLAWQVPENNFSRKLSSLRFMAQSFHRHLDRVFVLEEFDGYMKLVEETAPHLSRTVDALKREHEKLRTGIRRIVHGLEQGSSTDYAMFANTCNELLVLLQNLDEHNKKEAALFQEAFERDEGGEG
jgi:hypothetical protein